jgi:predicted tellurium resistance membrane protein TerC
VELFFMVENVFIFRVIVTAVKLPESLLGRALNIVVCGQIIFEALLFVGLAHHLRMLRILPHVLGLLLVYLGMSTSAEVLQKASSSSPPVEDHRSESEEDSLSSKVIRRISSAASLSDTDITPANQFLDVADDKLQPSVLGLAVGLLLTADFVFEIDTVLTKVDEITNPFIAFTSSALAAFALPEMFIASQELLLHFPSFKIGLGAVLCMFGIQMMLAPLVVLHPFATCLVMFGILIISMLPSLL